MSYLPQAVGASIATGNDMLIRIGMVIVMGLVAWGLTAWSNRSSRE
jgi:hypothetical protein